MSAAFAKFCCAITAIVLGIVTAINAYGLEIRSWSWLVFGTIAQTILALAAGLWSDDK